MPDPKGSALVKAVETLATQEEELATQKKDLFGTLNIALRPMGYQIVPIAGGAVTGRRRGRPPGSKRAKVEPKAKGRKRGRRSMSAAERSIVSRRMKAYWSKRKKSGKKAK